VPLATLSVSFLAATILALFVLARSWIRGEVGNPKWWAIPVVGGLYWAGSASDITWLSLGGIVIGLGVRWPTF
jgi:hypothetical protein